MRNPPTKTRRDYRLYLPYYAAKGFPGRAFSSGQAIAAAAPEFIVSAGAVNTKKAN